MLPNGMEEITAHDLANPGTGELRRKLNFNFGRMVVRIVGGGGIYVDDQNGKAQIRIEQPKTPAVAKTQEDT